MNIVLWIVAAFLALTFVTAGIFKATHTPAQIVEAGQKWAGDFSAPVVKAIGGLEVLGAVGLILPGVTKIAPILVPMAAVGLILVQLGAAATHARRGERPQIGANIFLIALAALVAWGRLGPYPLG